MTVVQKRLASIGFVGLMISLLLTAAAQESGARGDQLLARKYPLSAERFQPGTLPRIERMTSSQDARRVAEVARTTLFNGHLAPDLAVSKGAAQDKITLDISDQGDSIRFMNHTAYAKKAYPPRAVALDELVAFAKTFVSKKLLIDQSFKAMFPIGTGESFKFTESYSRVVTTYSTTDSRESLLYKMFVFRRYYLGVQLLGPSHKIVVTVTPDKRVIGIDIELPRIVAMSGTQQIVSSDEFKKRLITVAKPNSEQEFVKKEVREIVCGYFDRRDPFRPSGRASFAPTRALDPVCMVTALAAHRPDRRPLRRIVVPLGH